MPPGFLDVRPERRHLDPLVPLRVWGRLLGERRPAIFTLGRVEVDDVVDLVRGDEFAARASVTALATPRAIAPGPLAAPLAAGARRIARRGQVRVSRILAQSLGQLRHPLGQRRDLFEQRADLPLEP
jgi:hypothetical protein